MKISIIGTGKMALGIVQVFLNERNNITVVGRSKESCSKFKSTLFDTLKFKAKLSDEKIIQIMSNCIVSHDLNIINGSDIVIEAIIEDFSEKIKILKNIEMLVDIKSIIATNTSSISINKLSEKIEYKKRFLGIHFFNPVPLMGLIEIVKSDFTDDTTLETVKNLITDINKIGIITKDTPGFIVNRILIPMINDAIILLETKVADAENIDLAMKLGANFPIGPLALSDFIGNDIVLNILDNMFEQSNNDRFKSSNLLKNMVNSGLLGKKVKKGFYNY